MLAHLVLPSRGITSSKLCPCSVQLGLQAAWVIRSCLIAVFLTGFRRHPAATVCPYELLTFASSGAACAVIVLFHKSVCSARAPTLVQARGIPQELVWVSIQAGKATTVSWKGWLLAWSPAGCRSRSPCAAAPAVPGQRHADLTEWPSPHAAERPSQAQQPAKEQMSTYSNLQLLGCVGCRRTDTLWFMQQ